MVTRAEEQSINVPGAAAVPWRFGAAVPQARRAIAVAAEAIVDFVLEPGGGTTPHLGGGSFNAARTLGRLGLRPVFIGRVSTDRARAAMPDRAVALHVGGLGLAVEPQASALATLVREAGPETLVLLDPNCRDGVIRARTAYCDRLRDLMCLADVVKASEDDFAYLDPDRTPHQTARALLARGPAIVLLTNGSRGATVLTARYEGFVQAPVADVVDTTGAGDAFGAAWLGAWVADGLGRQDLGDFDAVLRTAEFAALVAARTCERAGADPYEDGRRRLAAAPRARREGGCGVVLRMMSGSGPGRRRC